MRLLFAKGTQGACGGVEEIGVGFEQRSVTGSKTHKEDGVRSVANGHAIFSPGEPAIHLRCLRIRRRRILFCFVDKESRGTKDGGTAVIVATYPILPSAIGVTFAVRRPTRRLRNKQLSCKSPWNGPLQTTPTVHSQPVPTVNRYSKRHIKRQHFLEDGPGSTSVSCWRAREERLIDKARI